jgi:hypothetical protein
MPKTNTATPAELFEQGKKILAQPAPQPPAPMPRVPKQRIGILLLNRAMDRADDEERVFLYDFLSQCATAPLTIQEVALHRASSQFKLGICAEDLTDSQAKVIRAVRVIEYTNPWL